MLREMKYMLNVISWRLVYLKEEFAGLRLLHMRENAQSRIVMHWFALHVSTDYQNSHEATESSGRDRRSLVQVGGGNRNSSNGCAKQVVFERRVASVFLNGTLRFRSHVHSVISCTIVYTWTWQISTLRFFEDLVHECAWSQCTPHESCSMAKSPMIARVPPRLPSYIYV